MNTVNVAIKEKENQYSIQIGSDILSSIQDILDVEKYSKIVLISDSNLKSYLPKLGINYEKIMLEPGEKSKNVDSLQKIWQQLIDLRCDRKALVLNFGGGVIGDMGGFAAATYMRGIDFVQIPTTLLAMVDASVGGKLAIDFGEVKNIVGAFVQPKAVLIDVNTLRTLPDREFQAGFAEIIKHGLIRNIEYFQHVTSKKPRNFSEKEMIEIITKSCEIKAQVVQADPTEQGERKILNFGHTIGHAIESLLLSTDHALLHGEAISIGMVAEAKIAQLQGYIEIEELRTIEKSLINAGLPIRIKELPHTEIMLKMKMDKKNSHGKIKWTLLRGLGNCDYNIEIGASFVEQAITYIIEK